MTPCVCVIVPFILQLRVAVFIVCRLMTDRVQLSATECNAVMSALMECSRFCISHCLTSSSSDKALADFVVSRIVSL